MLDQNELRVAANDAEQTPRLSPGSVTRAVAVPLCLIAIAHAIRTRSSVLIGQTMSHSRQYASMTRRDSINVIRARRVCPCCNRCCPQAGQVEAKARGFFMSCVD